MGGWFAHQAPMLPLERLDQLRRRTLLIGATLTVPAAFAAYLSTGHGLWKAIWLVGLGAALVWVSGQPADARRWRLIVPPTLGVAFGPLACALEPVGPVQLATVVLIPIVIAVLFIDAFDVVLWTSAVGWLSTVLFFVHEGWSATHVVAVAVFTGGVSVVIGLAAAGARKLRELDRESESAHSQALRLSESRRAQAERLAIVGRLASGVAHEINNPLAFVKANVGELRRSLLLGGDPLPPDELKEILDDTTQGIDRICQIVADLKGFAREDSGVTEPVDLRDVVTGAVRLATVRLPRDMKVNIEVPGALPPVRANQRKLAQVMLNLLVNAGEALEEVRTLKPEVTIRAIPEGNSMRVTVTDNGPGIPPLVMQRLFEPFFTTKPPGKGTGLGLALSREYVEAFGGTLSVANVEPHGAQFSIVMRVTAATGETPLPGSLDLGPQREALLNRHRRRTGS